MEHPRAPSAACSWCPTAPAISAKTAVALPAAANGHPYRGVSRMKTDDEKIRRVLDSARACIHRCQGPQAIAHLDDIRLEIDEFAGKSIWAEYALVYAGALGAMTDSGANAAFQEAFDRIFQLP